MKQITIMEHPLIQHKISILRNEATGTNEFRRLIEEIAMLMGYEALRDLPVEDVEIKTPIETCRTPMIASYPITWYGKRYFITGAIGESRSYRFVP